MLVPHAHKDDYDVVAAWPTETGVPPTVRCTLSSETEHCGKKHASEIQSTIVFPETLTINIIICISE